jgi:hypothetical protein
MDTNRAPENTPDESKDLDVNPPSDMRSSDHEDDIEKIMNEIENLREGMKATVASKNAPAPTSSARSEGVMEPETVPEPISEEDNSGFLPEQSTSEEIEEDRLKTDGEESWLEETYANLKATEAAVSDTPDPPTGLTLLVQGNMKVRLKHERTGQEVGVSFEGDSINVYLADGAELRIPVKMKKPEFGGARPVDGSEHKKRAA